MYIALYNCTVISVRRFYIRAKLNSLISYFAPNLMHHSFRSANGTDRSENSLRLEKHISAGSAIGVDLLDVDKSCSVT